MQCEEFRHGYYCSGLILMTHSHAGYFTWLLCYQQAGPLVRYPEMATNFLTLWRHDTEHKNSERFSMSVSGVFIFWIHLHPHLTWTYHCISNSWRKILSWMYTVMESGGHTDTSHWAPVPALLFHMATLTWWPEEIYLASGGLKEVWTLRGMGICFIKYCASFEVPF
jgi:hypothetical protein